MREEGGGGGEQGEGPDHRDRDPDPHGDRARLPPTARNVPEAGVSGALVNYFGSGVRRPYPWIVAPSKGTKIRVRLSQQSSLNPIRQVKSGTGEDRCHGGQCRPQRAQHCHLIGRFESSSLSSRCFSAARFLADVSPLSSSLLFSLRHSRIASESAIQLSKPGSPTFLPPLPFVDQT